jgi:hypothetical protein
MGMVKFTNRLFGTEMWVDEARVDEYIAAGHTPAASSPKLTEEPKAEAMAEKPKPKPKKASAKKK